MKKDEIYMTYLLLSPTKGMSGLVDNNESLLDSYVDLRNYAEFAIQHMLPNVSDEDKAKYGL